MVREHHHRLAKGNTTAMAEFIYSMRKVRKAHGDKVILDDVSLNFLPGAKIGVVGPNGAGKSSVLRIMAGLDIPNNGDALLQPDGLEGGPRRVLRWKIGSRRIGRHGKDAARAFEDVCLHCVPYTR